MMEDLRKLLIALDNVIENARAQGFYQEDEQGIRELELLDDLAVRIAAKLRGEKDEV